MAIEFDLLSLATDDRLTLHANGHKPVDYPASMEDIVKGRSATTFDQHLMTLAGQLLPFARKLPLEVESLREDDKPVSAERQLNAFFLERDRNGLSRTFRLRVLMRVLDAALEHQLIVDPEATAEAEAIVVTPDSPFLSGGSESTMKIKALLAKRKKRRAKAQE